jgi:hypothetical protein
MFSNKSTAKCSSPGSLNLDNYPILLLLLSNATHSETKDYKDPPQGKKILALQMGLFMVSV